MVKQAIALNVAERAPAGLSISAVERETGIPKDTLRVWERRYGFPAPLRDAQGERAYPQEQVERLRLVLRLLGSGLRPGRVVGLPPLELQQLHGTLALPAAARTRLPAPGAHDVLAQLRAHNADGLHHTLAQAALTLGLARFVTEWVAPMNAQVGDAWAQGTLGIAEEHLYTELVQGVLRNAIGHIPRRADAGRPRVLLTTFPREPHVLGLLMAQTLLTLEGCSCQSLGSQTPVGDIVRAAAAQHADIVGLSFTASLHPNDVLRGLAELRAQLPAAVAIWAGGECPVLQRRNIAGVRSIPGLQALPDEVQGWRREAVFGF